MRWHARCCVVFSFLSFFLIWFKRPCHQIYHIGTNRNTNCWRTLFSSYDWTVLNFKLLLKCVIHNWNWTQTQTISWLMTSLSDFNLWFPPKIYRCQLMHGLIYQFNHLQSNSSIHKIEFQSLIKSQFKEWIIQNDNSHSDWIWAQTWERIQIKKNEIFY